MPEEIKIGLENLEQIIEILPKDSLADIGTLITIVQTLGIFFIIYIIFQIINSILNFRRGRIVKKMSKKIDNINNKLDQLLNKNKHKEKSNKKKK